MKFACTFSQTIVLQAWDLQHRFRANPSVRLVHVSMVVSAGLFLIVIVPYHVNTGRKQDSGGSQVFLSTACQTLQTANFARLVRLLRQVIHASTSHGGNGPVVTQMQIARLGSPVVAPVHV